MALTLIRAGFASAVQDLGRHGYQKYGIIVGGVMDPPAAKLANWLVGNPDGSAMIEYSFLGPSVLFEEDTVFALSGADCRPELDGKAIICGRPYVAHEGEILSVGGMISGSRGYLAVAGGIATPEWLGSRSTYERAGQGGFKGRLLKDHDRLPVGRRSGTSAKLMNGLANTNSAVSWFFSLRRSYRGVKRIRVIPDELWNKFTESSRRLFQSAVYTITTSADRMGYRLDGPEVSLGEPFELYSEAVTNGSIQVPRSGHPIILMTDHQSTGGYPRIAQVATVDLPILAQLPPDSRIRFSLISVDKAENLLIQQEKQLLRLRKSVTRKLKSLTDAVI
ncbi:biotin-dependent carboxyltransferase family protein [Sporolactobacillus vineae]|uniref:5-oxoprolinase subunit C family protein n=1 Tax=Sporolactobacillus vineae TaxID=444463 RepID=UPI0002883A93|nr:biotin-dependent carboxyltransferase family protein [Sporolactobacillus vineae]